MRIPRDRSPDSTLALLREGYAFLPERLRRHGGDVVAARLLGRPAVLLHGPAAARLFYDPARFVRHGALPGSVRKTLTGEGAVQTLDGADHHARKEMFLRLMTPQHIDEFVTRFERAWRATAAGWERSGRVVLFDEMRWLLCETVCDWSGVPLPDGDARHRAHDLWAMVDGFAAVGPRHWRARAARRRSESWLEGLVDAVRDGRLDPAERTALAVFAGQRDPAGRLLDRRVAAVELLNVLRPVVAVAGYITFEALALHRHPWWRGRLRQDTGAAELFAQEVRRLAPFAPFAPFAGARVRADFEWSGHRFHAGTLVLLDIYGAHRDGRVWPRPDEFDPDRFRSRHGDAFDLIPQGGGEHQTGHRCAGEWLTVAVMESAARLLATTVEYHVPEQDLRVSLRRIPALPRSGFVIGGVRRARDGKSEPADHEGGTVSEPVTDETIRPEPGLLGIYLNDHLAGATAGVQLVRRLARNLGRTSMGEPLAGLADEVSRDREELTAIMAELGVPVRRYKLYTAAAAELAGRLKFNGHLLTRSPLSTVVELEMLRLGIEGKASGWRTLRTVGAQRGRPDPDRLDELIERAVSQAALVETLRVRAVSLVFGVPAPA